MTRLPLHPKHPERVCWGCDKFCPADELTCGNGTERTSHPVELFGPDWYLSVEGSEIAADDPPANGTPEPAPKRPVHRLKVVG